MRLQQLALDVRGERPFNPVFAGLLVDLRMGKEASDVPRLALPCCRRLPLNGRADHGAQMLFDDLSGVGIEVHTAQNALQRCAKNFLIDALLLRDVEQHVVGLAGQDGDLAGLRWHDRQRILRSQEK